MMSSCFNLRRLLPPKRVWKAFTSKLLLKLHRTMSIKKQRKRYLKPAKKNGWKSLSIHQPKKFKIQHHKPQSRLIHRQTSRHCYFQKGAAVPAVVVNHLCTDPTVTVVKGYVDPSGVAVEEKGDDPQRTYSTNSVTRRRGEAYKTSSSSCLESNKEEGKNTDDDGDDHRTVDSADEIWESSAMASPHMHGINERAEEFIAQFRAELRRQEIQANRRRLQ